jgi:hypothetical protein
MNGKLEIQAVMLTQENKKQHKPDRFEIIYNGIVWAFVGVLYAAFFIPVFEVTQISLPLWAAAVCATVAATAGGALVYSSSQLALLVAMFSNFVVFAYMLYSGEMASPLAPSAVGAGIGSIIGAMYGLIVKGSRIYRGEAILLAGVTVGVVVSVLSLVWILVFNASLVVLVVVLAPLSGLIYSLIVDSFIQRYSDILPPVADGAVAGAVIGGFVGFGLWVMGAIAMDNATPQWRDSIANIAQSTPIAIAAASVSTLLLGMLYAALRSRFEGLEEQDSK